MSDLVPYKAPELSELFADNIEDAFKSEQLNLLLNTEPKALWVKEHPYIKNYRYLPIDKVEFLLRKIFKRYRIEITGQGTSFNGVYVTVRVHYLNPVIGDWDYHDGIGACQLQTAKGTSPADLANINNGALAMAFPIAKTVAIKDACDHFGKLFGSDLNRKDTLVFSADEKLSAKLTEAEQLHVDLSELLELKKASLSESELKNANRILENKEVSSYKKLSTLLKGK